jgi:K+-transporting ATPase KdpF subunit
VLYSSASLRTSSARKTSEPAAKERKMAIYFLALLLVLLVIYLLYAVIHPERF